MRIPDLQPPHLGEAGHRLPVGHHRRLCHRLGVGLGDAVVAGGDGEAGRQPLDVTRTAPAGSRQSRSGRTAAPARARRRPRSWTGGHPHNWASSPAVGWGQVGGHDLGRPPVEGERRHQHPPVPHRDQVRLPGAVLLLQQPDRVGPAGGRHPAAVAGQRPIPRLQSPRSAVVHAGVRDPLDGHRLCPLFLGPRWPRWNDISQVPSPARGGSEAFRSSSRTLGGFGAGLGWLARG